MLNPIQALARLPVERRRSRDLLNRETGEKPRFFEISAFKRLRKK